MARKRIPRQRISRKPAASCRVLDDKGSEVLWELKIEVVCDFKTVVKVYHVQTHKWSDIESVTSSIRRDDNYDLVCDRRRDFGGCGKDAVKLEKNVPLNAWLSEIHAAEVTPVTPT